MSYDSTGNRYKLVHKLCENCKYELRKQFFVNRLVKLWNMLPDEVVLDSSVNSLRDTKMNVGVTGVCVIITKPTCSTGSHNVTRNVGQSPT